VTMDSHMPETVKSDMSRLSPDIAVFTDHGDPENFQPFRISIPARVRGRFPGALDQGWRLWRAGVRHPGTAAYVTCGSTAGFVLAALQAIARFWRQPRTHLMFDLLLEHRRRGLIGLYDRLKAAAFRAGRVRAVVWGMTDGDDFAVEHELPRDRFLFHPYHATLEGFSYEVRDAGYLFAGGNNGRDYETLLAALGPIGYPMVIATMNPEIPCLARAWSHIEVRGVTAEEFRRLLAGCTALVEAHPVDFPRTAGHQTLLNAMCMGKPIVLADERSAAGYVENEVEALVVPAGDVPALRRAVKRLLADGELRRRLAAAGQSRLEDPLYSTACHMQSIYNLALQFEYRRLGRDSAGPLIEMYGPASAGICLPESGAGLRRQL
jgi:glycosyltransferase involved in cell wall biosynthesis